MHADPRPGARPAVDWAEVRQAYCDTDLSVKDILVLFEIGRRELYDRLHAEAWPARADERRADEGQGEEAQADGTPGRPPGPSAGGSAPATAPAEAGPRPEGRSDRAPGGGPPAPAADARPSGRPRPPPLRRTSPRARGRRKPYDRARLVTRLFVVVDRQIGEIEARLGRPGDLAGPADEKDARTLAALARTLELLIGLEKQAAPAETTEVDIDAFREDLARRIEGLRRQG